LQKSSISAYERKHGTTVSDERLTKEQKDAARSSVFLSMALNARTSAESLYESCHAVKKNFGFNYVKLKMDVSRKSNGLKLKAIPGLKDITMTYQFLVSWSSQFIEIVINGPCVPKEAQGQERPIPEGAEFSSAISDALQSKPLQFQDQELFRTDIVSINNALP